MSVNWLIGDTFIAALDKFHTRYATQPQEINEVKCILHDLMSEIDRRFRHLGISHYVEYAGSCYEGVHVPKEDGRTELDFEAIFVIDKHAVELEAHAIAQCPGYASLKLRNDVIPQSRTDVSSKYTFFGFPSAHCTGNLDPIRMMDTFSEELQKCVQHSEVLSKQVSLRRNGKAIMLDVYQDNGPPFWGPRFFTIEVIPAYEVSGELYVAKPPQEESMPNSFAFRRLFSLKEKSILLSIARNNQHRKQVFITLKAIRNREPGLAQLSSYLLKTVFFWTMLGSSSQSSTYGTLSQNVIAVLRLLQNMLVHTNLPHFFLPEKNLLADMTDAASQNLLYTLNCLLTNERKMTRVLTLWQQGTPFLEILRDFLGRNKRLLDQRVNDSKDMCLMYTSAIERLLQQNFPCRFRNTGSLFQGIGAQYSNKTALVYEMLMITSCHNDELKPYRLLRRPGQVYLEPRTGDTPSQRLKKSLSYYTFLSALNSAAFLDPLKTARNCFQEIRKCVYESSVLKGKVCIRRNGPFIRVSIYPWSGRLLWGKQLCSVDLIPSYEVGGSIYVPKSADGLELLDGKAWRQSFVSEEEQFWARDREGECRKAVLCILQLLCAHDFILSQLSSYHLKTALFLEHSDSLDWSDEKLAERLMGVLERLYRCLKESNLPDHFLPQINLLADISPTSICELHQRIHTLCSDEVQMMKAINF